MIVAVAAVMSLGAMTDAAVQPVLVLSSERKAEAQRDAVARWLHSLSDAARDWRGPTPAIATPRPCAEALQVVQRSEPVPVHSLVLTRDPLVRPQLIDLPPPAGA